MVLANSGLFRLKPGEEGSSSCERDLERDRTPLANPCKDCSLPSLVGRWKWEMEHSGAGLNYDGDNCDIFVTHCYRRGFGCLAGQTAMCFDVAEEFPGFQQLILHSDVPNDSRSDTTCSTEAIDAICSMSAYPMTMMGIPINIRQQQRRGEL
jgi:hypothetical protein